MSVLNNTVSRSLADYADVLGYVVWHSIADIRVSESEIASIAGIYGISDPPKLGSPSDAFRRATSASQVRDENSHARYLMRPVSDNADSVIREIVVERVDAKGKRLAHYGAVRITYTKATEQTECETIAPAWAYEHEKRTAANLADAAVTRYREYRESLTGKELTRFAHKQLERMSYIMLRPNGGCYFVLAKHRSQLESLMGFFAHLARYKVSQDPIICSAAPVPNDPMQREQVAIGAYLTVSSEIDSLIGRLADLRDNIGSVRQSTLESKAREVAELRNKAEAYARALQQESGMLDARFQILDGAIDALFARYSEAEYAKAATGRKTLSYARKIV